MREGGARYAYVLKKMLQYVSTRRSSMKLVSIGGTFLAAKIIPAWKQSLASLKNDVKSFLCDSVTARTGITSAKVVPSESCVNILEKASLARCWISDSYIIAKYSSIIRSLRHASQSVISARFSTPQSS